jgi:hypothetical protein
MGRPPRRDVPASSATTSPMPTRTPPPQPRWRSLRTSSSRGPSSHTRPWSRNVESTTWEGPAREVEIHRAPAQLGIPQEQAAPDVTVLVDAANGLGAAESFLLLEGRLHAEEVREKGLRPDALEQPSVREHDRRRQRDVPSVGDRPSRVTRARTERPVDPLHEHFRPCPPTRPRLAIAGIPDQPGSHVVRPALHGGRPDLCCMEGGSLVAGKGIDRGADQSRAGEGTQAGTHQVALDVGGQAETRTSESVEVRTRSSIRIQGLIVRRRIPDAVEGTRNVLLEPCEPVQPPSRRQYARCVDE